jgi:DNA modification methylase
MVTPLKLWSDEEYQDDTPIIKDAFTHDSSLVTHADDAYEFLGTLPSSLAQLIITSPPYNVGKEYETRIKIREYLSEQEKVIDELVRILDEKGSICWQVGNYVENGESFPLDIFYYSIFKDRGLKLRNRIIWRYNHGLHMSKRFSGRYETILWFTKGDDYMFNLDSVRVPSKYPGKRSHKGINKGKPSGNPLGKNPSDIWDIVVEQWKEEVWDIPQVKAAHPEKTEHPAQYPIELVERCVLALTNEDDWILDPYCGVRSSLIAGLKHNRKVIGCDKEIRYIEIAKERIKAFCIGKLPMRPIERELYKPQGKVSKVPDEWEAGDIKHVYDNDKRIDTEKTSSGYLFEESEEC